MSRIFLPGATLGVLGGGQLGRMFALAARAMGYRVHTLSPGTDTPTGQVADLEVAAEYDDLDAILAFARGVDVITFEFENVPTSAADAASTIVPVRPTGHALHVVQERGREKAYLALKGFPVTPFEPVATLDELTAAVARVGLPAILKTASFGYDGKGQHRISADTDLMHVWDTVGRQSAILERAVDFSLEFSVVGARGLDGAFAHYGAIENAHRHHILDVSVVPARLPASSVAEAVEVTRAIMDDLHYVGVLCVEFFLARNGSVLVNEIAPRPHNSGHLTIDAHATSQFGQQVRAVCGLPLGATTLHRPAAMANLLGEVWIRGEPQWSAALALPDVALHLYGKRVARPGRKMGHLTALAATPDDAVAHVLAARDLLA